MTFIAFLFAAGILWLVLMAFWVFTKFHLDYQFLIYFTTVGLTFSWSLIEKSRKHFFVYVVPFWLLFGYFLFYKYLEADYLVISIVGIPLGYVLYKLGLVDLLDYPKKTYSEKFKNMSLVWLILFWRCKLKKHDIYQHDGNSIQRAIVIYLGESKEFFKIYFFDAEGIERISLQKKEATLKFLEKFVDKKLLVHPDMEILITGDANENVVFSLMNLLLKNRFNKVGFLSASSMGNLLSAFKELKNDKENERKRITKKILQKSKW